MGGHAPSRIAGPIRALAVVTGSAIAEVARGGGREAGLPVDVLAASYFRGSKVGVVAPAQRSQNLSGSRKPACHLMDDKKSNPLVIH